jgi:hypothetical protein
VSTLLTKLPPLDFAQVLGLLSFALGILCFYPKDDRRLKITMIVMNINHALHFALLGALTACLGVCLRFYERGFL